MLWIFLILFTTSFFYVTILSFHKLLGAFLVKNTLSDRLNYLTTLAEEQSITRAAARLFISQPALTAFLNRTEEELGARLFDRSTTPIRITEAGAYYLSELEKICVMQDRLHQELSDFSSNDLELRINIGIGRNRGSIWLSSVLPELNRLYPDMRLTIFEDRDINMLDKVLNGVVDIAIVESYTYHSSLHYLRLPSEQYMFITSCENPRMAAYRDAACSPEAPLDIDAGWLADDLFICPSFKGRMEPPDPVDVLNLQFPAQAHAVFGQRHDRLPHGRERHGADLPECRLLNLCQDEGAAAVYHAGRQGDPAPRFCTVQGRAKARPAARFHAAAARPHEHRHLRQSHPDGVYVR